MAVKVRVVLILWAVVPVGVEYQTSCISDTYVTVHNSSKIRVCSSSENSFMVGTVLKSQCAIEVNNRVRFSLLSKPHGCLQIPLSLDSPVLIVVYHQASLTLSGPEQPHDAQVANCLVTSVTVHSIWGLSKCSHGQIVKTMVLRRSSGPVHLRSLVRPHSVHQCILCFARKSQAISYLVLYVQGKSTLFIYIAGLIAKGVDLRLTVLPIFNFRGMQCNIFYKYFVPVLKYMPEQQ